MKPGGPSNGSNRFVSFTSVKVRREAWALPDHRRRTVAHSGGRLPGGPTRASVEVASTHHRVRSPPVDRAGTRHTNEESAQPVAILPNLNGPADLRGLSHAQLEQLAREIRETIIETVAHTGGHLGSSLGVVELTIVLHRLLESPRDRIVWDTGHQAYPHKLLTGRLERFGTLRQIDGVGGFPRRSESPHDVFDGGHAGTGLSVAQGLATARDLRHGLERIAVVVGDAALMSGLSFEALNDIGQRQTRMLIVLNDNEMSISPTVGALSKYLVDDQALVGLAGQPDRLRPTRSNGCRSSARPRSSSRSGCAGRSSSSRSSRAACSRTSASVMSGSFRATTSRRSR